MPGPHWASLVSTLIDLPQTLSCAHSFILSFNKAARKQSGAGGGGGRGRGMNICAAGSLHPTFIWCYEMGRSGVQVRRAVPVDHKWLRHAVAVLLEN